MFAEVNIFIRENLLWVRQVPSNLLTPLGRSGLRTRLVVTEKQYELRYGGKMGQGNESHKQGMRKGGIRMV